MLKALYVVICLGVAIVFLPAPAGAEEQDLRSELKQAQEEIKALRAEVTELKQNSAWQYQADLKKMMAEMPQPAKAQETTGGIILPAGWNIQPYGYFKFDMSYDDSAISAGDYIGWVLPEDKDTRADDQWNFTARETRLGTKIFAPDIGDVKVMGRVEIDFYGGGTTQENKAGILLRHAYGQLTGPDWSVLFGQTSDIISPLYLNTIDYTVGWWGGNIGYRHPQLALSKWWNLPCESTVKVQAGLSREVGENHGFGSVDDGQDASTPTLQGRVSLATPLAGQQMEVGVSGHLGREEIDAEYIGDDDEVESWSLNGDLLLPINKQWQFKGEVFWGKNLDSYLGGIGQGINSVTLEPIESVGGWCQLGYTPCEKWAFYGGFGIDDPRDGDLQVGSRSNNQFAFVNANYYLSKYLSTGLEITYWQTDYKRAEDGDDLRIQHSWKLSF